ncbi:MAG: translation initiation factor IF-2 [Desulfovibrio sp.]|nr:translation initiation factor IF-2 [Desulfovibrio sp.]
MVSLSRIQASAVTPDQLLPYVKAISGLESEPCHKFVLHSQDDFAVLVAFPEYGETGRLFDNEEFGSDLDTATGLALAKPGLKNLTVLSPVKPSLAPANASINADRYWKLDLPAGKPGQKLRNLLKSANLRLRAGRDAWSADFQVMAAEFCERKKLDAASSFLYSRLGQYLEKCPEAVLYSARNEKGELMGCAIADYSALSTAFYMFAFGKKEAPPGTADLLLSLIVRDSEAAGFGVLNLGLGINPGIEFFKKKWGAAPFLPLTETAWEIRKKGFFKRLFV